MIESKFLLNLEIEQIKEKYDEFVSKSELKSVQIEKNSFDSEFKEEQVFPIKSKIDKSNRLLSFHNGNSI